MRITWVPVGIFCATDAENIKALTWHACRKTFQFLWHLYGAIGLTVVFLGEFMKGWLAKRACPAWSYSPVVVSVSQERKPKESEKKIGGSYPCISSTFIDYFLFYFIIVVRAFNTKSTLFTHLKVCRVVNYKHKFAQQTLELTLLDWNFVPTD